MMLPHPKAGLPSIEPEQQNLPGIKDVTFLLAFRAYEAVHLEGAKDPVAALEWYIEKAPKRSCPKCHGRGTIGRDTKTGFHRPCPCVGKARIVQINKGLIERLAERSSATTAADQRPATNDQQPAPEVRP